jgi:hypothetical protein
MHFTHITPRYRGRMQPRRMNRGASGFGQEQQLVAYTEQATRASRPEPPLLEVLQIFPHVGLGAIDPNERLRNTHPRGKSSSSIQGAV